MSCSKKGFNTRRKKIVPFYLTYLGGSRLLGIDIMSEGETHCVRTKILEEKSLLGEEPLYWGGSIFSFVYLSGTFLGGGERHRYQGEGQRVPS